MLLILSADCSNNIAGLAWVDAASIEAAADAALNNLDKEGIACEKDM